MISNIILNLDDKKWMLGGYSVPRTKATSYLKKCVKEALEFKKDFHHFNPLPDTHLEEIKEKIRRGELAEGHIPKYNHGQKGEIIDRRIKYDLKHYFTWWLAEAKKWCNEKTLTEGVHAGCDIPEVLVKIGKQLIKIK